MPTEKSSRHVVLTLLAFSTMSWLSEARAQDQAACGTQAEALLTQALKLLQPGAGTGTQNPDGPGKAYRHFGEKCVEEKRCGPMELQLSVFEASLDDTMVTLQRQKLARFKAVIGVKTSRNEVCAAVPKLEELITELKDLNDQQMSRLDQLSPTLFSNPVGFLR